MNQLHKAIDPVETMNMPPPQRWSTPVLTGAIACLCLLLHAQAHAQVQPPTAPLPPSLDPGAVQRQTIERQRQLLEEERQRARTEPSTAPIDKGAVEPKAPPQPGAAGRIAIKQIVFTRSDILTVAELAAVATDFEGKVATFSDLQTLVGRVNALYEARGAIAAQAMVPAQDISGGTIQIRLVEGRIGAYTLSGNDTTQEAYVLARLHEAPGSLVYLAPLERDLIWFNRSNDAQLRTKLQPGTAFGTTDVGLMLEEPPRHGFSLFADNAGSHSTGELRVGAVYVNHSALRYRDEFTLSATRAAGYDGRALSYAFPVNTWGGRASVGYNDDRTHVKFGPFAVLNISGASESWTAQFRQPLYVDQRTLFTASVGAVSRRAVTYIESLQLQRVETLDYSAGFDTLVTDEQGSWFNTVSIVTGDARSPDRLGYTLERGTLQRTQYFGGDIEGRATLGWQLTDNDHLPSSAQYFLGGSGTVRGYSTSFYSGLSGYALNLEVRRTLKLDQASAPGVTLLGFFDSGQTRPDGPGLNVINLQSVGVGAELRFGSAVFTRITLGQQLRKRVEEPRGYSIDVTMVLQSF